MIANPGNPSSHAARPAALRLAVFPELDAPAEQGGGPLRPLTLRPQTGWLRAETCPGGNVTVTFACMSKSKEEKVCACVPTYCDFRDDGAREHGSTGAREYGSDTKEVLKRHGYSSRVAALACSGNSASSIRHCALPL